MTSHFLFLPADQPNFIQPSSLVLVWLIDHFNLLVEHVHKLIVLIIQFSDIQYLDNVNKSIARPLIVNVFNECHVVASMKIEMNTKQHGRVNVNGGGGVVEIAIKIKIMKKKCGERIMFSYARRQTTAVKCIR